MVRFCHAASPPTPIHPRGDPRYVVLVERSTRLTLPVTSTSAYPPQSEFSYVTFFQVLDNLVDVLEDKTGQLTGLRGPLTRTVQFSEMFQVQDMLTPPFPDGIFTGA